MKKDAGGGKKEAREIKGPGKTTNKSEGPKGEPGGIQGKAEDGAKEAGKAKDKSGKSKEAPEVNKEAPGESKEASVESKEETDQDQVMPLQILSHILGLWVQLCAAPPIRVPSPGGRGGGRRAEGAVPRAGSVPVDGDAAFPARFPACSRTFPLSPPRRLPGTFGTRRRRFGSSSGTASRSVTPFLSCSQLQGHFGVWPWDGSRVTPRQPHHPRAHARLVAATQLKPDVGTPELPAGRVRLRLEGDGSVAEVDEDSVQRVRPLRGLPRGWGPHPKHRARGRMTPWKPPSRSQDGEGAVPVATRMVAPVAGCSLMVPWPLPYRATPPAWTWRRTWPRSSASTSAVPSTRCGSGSVPSSPTPTPGPACWPSGGGTTLPAGWRR